MVGFDARTPMDNDCGWGLQDRVCIVSIWVYINKYVRRSIAPPSALSTSLPSTHAHIFSVER